MVQNCSAEPSKSCQCNPLRIMDPEWRKASLQHDVMVVHDSWLGMIIYSYLSIDDKSICRLEKGCLTAEQARCDVKTPLYYKACTSLHPHHP